MSGDIEGIHTSVLLKEILDYLQPQAGGTYVDGTLGLGGHTKAILQASNPDGRVIAFDWDEDAIKLARERLKMFAERLIIERRNFAELGAGLAEQNIQEIDGMMLDVGLSSLQLDQGGRGFSFKRDELLDMRMDIRRKMTAADLLATCTEKELADIFFYYGEEIQSRRIAAEIVNTRKKERITNSKQLSAIVARSIPRRFHPKKIHVATKVFQGLRIAVNRELENLSRIVDEATVYLKPGARFCVITFHSLEDRIVKRKFRENGNLEVLTTKPIVASKSETKANPRSRSAKLRVAVKKP